VGSTTNLHLLSRYSRETWQQKIYPVVESYITSTQPLREKVFGKLIQPPLAWLKDKVRCLGRLLDPFLNPIFDRESQIRKNIITRCVLWCLEAVGWLAVFLLVGLIYLGWGLYRLWRILWWPFRYIGYKLHDDPDWDRILLWNLTIPFPYLCPIIFGPLRPRPRTDYEWQTFPRPALVLEYETPQGPTHGDWMARTIPDNQGPCLNAECWLDFPLDTEVDLSVTCLLILRRHQIHGLLLQRHGQVENQYQRVGMFKASSSETCFAWTEEAMQSIMLI
jgi:hypothetical protein